MPDSTRQETELTRARLALVHSLANGIGIITANLSALRAMQTDPEGRAMCDDMLIAAERVHKTFEALRKLA